MQNAVTPMMKQYMQVKSQYMDCILFYRLGDFYEMFFDDAIKASKELDLTLTGRNCGKDEKAPMCGVPFHSAQSYIAKLVNKGYKVAICEQLEDPSTTKDIVKRDVIRVITPGTANIDGVLCEEENNFLAMVYHSSEGCAITFVDVSTGEMFSTEIDGDDIDSGISNTLASFKPSEVIANQSSKKLIKLMTILKKRFFFYDAFLDDSYFSYNDAKKIIMDKFDTKNLCKEIFEKKVCVISAGATFKYLAETQKTNLSHINKINYFKNENYMGIDVSSRRNLELTETMREKSKRGSLLWVLDKTHTSMGSRLMRKWIERPLTDSFKINERLDAIDEIVLHKIERDDICECLKRITDIERIVSKIVYGSANARDLISLGESLDVLPAMKESLSIFKNSFLKNICESIDALCDLRYLIASAFVDEPPVSIKEGGMIREGFDENLDRVKNVMKNGRKMIIDMEAKEREKTGIKNLKISYNKVFGYYIEISKSNINRAPTDYIRKQTLTNCERYITSELKDLESTVLGAKERVFDIEYNDFMFVKSKINQRLPELLTDAEMIAQVDVLCSLANVAINNNYVKPVVDDGDVIDIKNGRHPIVEIMQNETLFVPNDTYLDTDDNRFCLITGPNMAGKSTYMRQTAIITIMAQIGSFVPASSCHIGIVDKVFTRVGASDDLSAGQSTFMLEMTEVANIIKNATPRSLLILDEIGRGTSTFDGLSIAWSITEYLTDKQKLGAKSMFATHYHELIALSDTISGIKNYSIAVKKRGDDVIFLRKIVSGGTDDSFGIEVAKLAGIPDDVIQRAKEVLYSIESKSPTYTADDIKNTAFEEPPRKPNDDIIKELMSFDVSTMTPIEAMGELFKLQKKVSELYGQD